MKGERWNDKTAEIEMVIWCTVDIPRPSMRAMSCVDALADYDETEEQAGMNENVQYDSARATVQMSRSW